MRPSQVRRIIRALERLVEPPRIVNENYDASDLCHNQYGQPVKYDPDVGIVELKMFKEERDAQP